jgi:chromosome segregation ATPase
LEKGGKMENNEILVKVKNIDEMITEFSFLLENVKSILGEFDEKKDLIKNLEKIQDIKNEIDEFKTIYTDFEKTREDVTFLLQAASKIMQHMQDYATQFETNYKTISNILEEETAKIDELIIKNYSKILKNIKNALYEDIRDLAKELKIINSELKKVYNEDYFEDVKKLKKQLNFSNFIAVFLFILSVFFFYNLYTINKKMNYMEKIIIANYKILYNN